MSEVDNTIGTYRRHYSSKTYSSYIYDYEVGGVQYNGSDSFASRNYPRERGNEDYEGKQFLVLYDKEDPKNSIIRFDYPIKDSTDFRRYVDEFETYRKSLK